VFGGMIPIPTHAADVQQAISKSLGLAATNRLEIAITMPQYRIPFFKGSNEETFVVAHKVGMGNRTNVSVRTYFSKEGRFLRMESVASIQDPRRMSADLIEKGGQRSDLRIIGLGGVGSDFDFSAFWQKVCSRIPMEAAKEFNATAVLLETKNGESQPVIILNIWGIPNPLGMPDDAPELLKNRERVFLKLDGEILSRDNLL
jgi:hypothetical protein